MNRRDMLRLLLGTAAATAVDFEQLLWVPKPIVVVPALPKRLTLESWAMRMDPNQRLAAIVEILAMENELLVDQIWADRRLA